jgi:2-iminobutanoate/2-iminopropanoate deaminase
VTGSIEAEARRALQNLTAVLAAGGATWEQVVKTTIYLTDLGDFAAVNAVYAEFAGSTPPSRATVQVSALPRGAAVEVDAIAHLGARS